MSYKYEDVFELMRSTASDVTKDIDNWIRFLSSAAMNYKRPFYNQLLIYNQKPDATACATFDFWNQKMGRYVKKGAKGIITIDPASQRKEVLFDVSDTENRKGAPLPVWKVTSEMYALLGATLQEHFETSVTSEDLVAVLFDIGTNAVENVLPQLVDAVKDCRENSLLEMLDDVNLENVLKETLTESLVYMLLKRCDLQPEDYFADLSFPYIKGFNTYETIAALGSFLNNTSIELFKDISLAVRTIEKTLDLRENINKEAVENESNLQETRGLSGAEHFHSETGDGDREVRHNAENLSDEREEVGIHSDDDKRDVESTSERGSSESDGDGIRLDSEDGAERGREREPEGEEPHEVGGDDEQLPSLGGGDSSSRVDLRLNEVEDSDSSITIALDDVSKNQDNKHPDLPFEYVLTNVLQHHRFLKRTGAEIQNYFVDHQEGEAEKIEFLQEVYNQDYTEIITPEDEYRVGYHASENGLEVWTGAYLGSTSRVTVPWNVVVNAIDILIAQDEFLSLSEKVELPSVEQQVLFAEEAEMLNSSTDVVGFSLPQQIIDEVICSGSNERDSVLSICAYYKRNHTTDENVKFLANEYGSGTGKGFIIDGERYSVLFEDNGIRIAEGNSAVNTESSAFLSWNAVDKRIKELLALGRYVSAADYAEVENKLFSKTADVLWEICSIVERIEAGKAFSLNAFEKLKALEVRRKGHPDGTALIKDALSDPEQVKALLQETKLLISACKGAEPLLRVRWYEFNYFGEALSLLDTLSRDVQEYPADRPFEPSYKTFITDDEVDLDLMSGSHVQDGKYRIYLHFLEPHSASERVAFLKDEYGIGGNNNALGGVFHSDHKHDGKGIVLSKGDISKPYDTVTLTWSTVTKKIDKLINDGRYLTQKELEYLPEYEKRIIAERIYYFFEGLPVEVERMFSLGKSADDSIDEIVELLGSEEKNAFIYFVFEDMQKVLNNMSKDAYHYQYKTNCLEYVKRYFEGVSLFDIEARKRRGEWDEAREELEQDPVQIEQQSEPPVDNTAYTYDVKVGDVVYIGTNKYEVLSMENNEVVVNDVDFPLFMETYAFDDFMQKVKENPENDSLRVPVENVVVAELPAESPVADVSEALPSDEPVYRYYYRLKHPSDGYPANEDNMPLNVVAFDERVYVEDFGIHSFGYVEYTKPLSIDDMNKFDLMLYEPPIFSRETSKKYQLGFGMLGNGTTVWNRLETEDRDYKTVAHISEEGNITFYDKNMPQEAIDKIQAMADRDKAAWEEKLRLAAEAMAEVEKQYGSPFAKKSEEKTINRRTMPCRNYTAFKKFAEDILNGKNTYMRFERDGYEPLYIELIDKNTIAMAHTFVQNGDLCYDPEMVITFDNEKEELQACSYELSLAGLYQRVYDDNGNANLGLQRELNSFLNTWLKNIIEQDRALVRVIDRDGNEIDFTTDKTEEIVSEPVVAGEREVADAPNIFSADDRFTYNGEEFVVKDADGPLEDMDEVLLVSTVNPEKVLVTTYGALRGVLEGEGQEPNIQTLIYRYYFNDENSQGIYPSSQENKPVNFVSYNNLSADEYGVDSFGYVEYTQPLSFENLLNYNLFVVSRDNLKKYQPKLGLLGEGTEVLNCLEYEDESFGDYKTLAYISQEGDIKLYDTSMPREVNDEIKAVAENDRRIHLSKVSDSLNSISVGDTVYVEGKNYSVVKIEGTGLSDFIVLESVDNPGTFNTESYDYVNVLWQHQKDGDFAVGLNDRVTHVTKDDIWVTSSGFDFDEYLKIKDVYPDDIVAYQIGDFYEFLGEDAEKVANELDLILTSRDVGLSERLAMCGVPVHSFKDQMQTLIQNGYNVAVHGFDENTGKRVTVDFESDMHSASSPVSDISDEDKLVFEPVEPPERDVITKLRSAKRDGAIDYRIEHLAQDAKSPKERFKDNIAAISLLKQLEAENRMATSEEQKVLAAYVGWGGLADAFEDNKSAWASEYEELKELLTPEEYASARSSTLTAFYTSPEIIQFMYKTLENMGFKKGNILEPSCGVGNFIGMLPESLADSKVYGVELDSISGRIAQQLYQKQDIRVQGFEKTDFPDSFFDVAIGNVPFNDIRIADKRYDKHHWLIHDYFFGKTLDKVRPGGVIAFITSKGTLDKENPAVRKYIAERAEFLGAVRLPDNAFKANAGTEVTSDIIFLQKREKPIEIDEDFVDWIDLSYLQDSDTGEIVEAPNGKLMKINSYFNNHPEYILGETKVESTQYGYDTTCKAHEGVGLTEQFERIHINTVQNINERSYEEQESVLESIPADPSVRNFSYTLVDGAVYYRENSQMYPCVFKSEDAENRVKELIKIRESVRTLISMQIEDYSEAAIIHQREALNSLYDSFSEKYGLINDRKNRKEFEADGSYYLLASLENLDDEGKLKSKADIFYKRTIKPHVPVTSVDTSAEALEVSISEKACVDIPFMVQLSGKSAEEIEQDLVGVIFRVPGAKTDEGAPVFVPADEYLSGNVREKLRVAKRFAEFEEVYGSNVEALEKVQPKDLDASEISVRLGSTWIPREYIDQFMYELLDTPRWARDSDSYGIKTKFAEITGEWFIENKTQDKYNVKATTSYGTERRSAYQIIEDTLNLRDSRVYDYVEDENGRKKAVLNREETAIAQQKQEIIKETFVEWIWQDAERREYLTSYYNEHFNNIRPREYDGSHLRFSGINPEIELQKHQLNAIARIIYGGNTLLAHAVGAGKTFEMVAAAQESKRLGLCNKSMFVVPNHLIEQFAADYMKLYPSANVLCSTKKDFEPANRKKFCSRIATGDYDAIIIGHSQFEKIPMSAEGQRKAIQEQLNDVVAGIAALQHKEGQRFSVKQLEKTKKNLEAKLEKLNDDSRKDDVITFEELGVDRLFVDEAHYYKNLFLYTKMRNVAGIGSREAQKSSDLFMKCRYLDKLTDGKGVIFATGTPISNSMTELYTMQRYLQYDLLCENGLQHFDSWASTFGETITAIELAPEGKGYRAKTRFARFHNLPELMATFKEMADVQTADMLHLPVPKANFHVVDLQPSEIQKDLVQGLADRATAIHNKLVKPNEDNMLLVTNDGRKLALDQRLIDPLFEDSEISKVNSCAENVFEIWEKTKEEKSTQLVFCDLSTPKSGEDFDVYNDLRDKLVAKGIPKNEIVFIHNAKTEQQKKNLFDKMRKGKVRVLMGSTQKLGAGTNVQDKLIALHDIDCPWRPSDLEQRLGRIVRQGNSNDEVEIFRYVTKDTFDAYLYQLIENKQSFISQIMTSKSPSRSAEDIDEAVLSYAEIKSLATGDPRIKEKMDLDVSVKRLKLLKQSYLREKYSLEDKVLKTFPKNIAYYKDSIAKCKKDVAVLEKNTSSDKEYFFPMTVDGVTYHDKGEAGEALITFCRNKKKIFEESLGEYRGFKLSVEFDTWNKVFKLILKNELKYSIELGKDKFGNITRINNALNSLPERLAEFENKLENVYVQMENAKVQLEKPFAYEQELKEKSARLDQLNIELSLDKENSIDIASSLEEEPTASRKSTVMGKEER